MILATISRTSEIASVYNSTPFVYKALPSTYSPASFWTGTFGVESTTSTETISIDQVVVDSLTTYFSTDSESDMMTLPQSFYWVSGTQELYVHFLDTHTWYNSIASGVVTGFSDTRGVYVDNIWYAPLITEITDLSKDQDLQTYDEMSLISGSITFNNIGGELDFLIDENVNGNNCNVYYLSTESDASQTDFEAQDTEQLFGLYIEDYSLSLKEAVINVQDRRKAFNISVPTETFSVDDYPYLDDSDDEKIIPLAYGTIYCSEATCVNPDTDTDVVYRQALTLTSLGTVKLLIDDVWTEVTPSSTDLDNGSFTVAAATARDSDDEPYDCRVWGSVGIAITSALDIIKDLNDRYVGIEYLSSFYNTAEWAEATSEVSEIGILLTDQEELYSVIAQIQNGCNVGFRYDTLGTGKYTARVDDEDREETFYIESKEIKDIDTLGYETDIDTLTAEVVINYAQDYAEDEYLTVRNSDNYNYSRDNYGIIQTLESDTFITDAATAEERALHDAVKYKDIRKIVTITAMGDGFLGLQIYDTGTVELSPCFVDRDTETVTGTRCWLGVWKVQVVGIAPDISTKTNTLRLLLVEKKWG